ncbi:MAG: hypothetical protein ABJH04_07470 [Cyclobacteriaceae bacterium]
MSLFLQQSQTQKLSQSAILAQRLIAMPSMELNQYIRQEIDTNPSLEEEIPDLVDTQEHSDENDLDLPDYLVDDIAGYKMQSDGYSEEKYRPEVSAIDSLNDQLIEQLRMTALSDKQKYVCVQIIGSLDKNGLFGTVDQTGKYIPEDIQQFTEKLKEELPTVTLSDTETALKVVQSFEPAGVAARDSRECLLIQLDRLPQSRASELAIETLKFGWNDLHKKDYKHLAKSLDIKTERDIDNLQKAIQIIAKLSPYPIQDVEKSTYKSSVQDRVADFIVRADDGELTAQVNNSAIPNLFISKSYANTVEKHYKQKLVVDQVKIHRDYVNRGKELISSIDYRNKKLQSFIDLVAHHQAEFFLTGDHTKLSPLSMTELSAETGFSVNTISVMCKDKFIDTNFGMVKLRDLFDLSLDKSSNINVTRGSVESVIQKAVGFEDKSKPLTDDSIAEIIKKELKLEELKVKTVTNLRRTMKIPNAALRTDISTELHNELRGTSRSM